MTAPAPQIIVGSRSARHLPVFALAACVLLPAAGCGSPSAEPPWSAPTDPTVERPEGDTGPEADADTDADADSDTGCEADMDMTDWPVGALIVGCDIGFGGSDNEGRAAAGQDVDGDGFDDILVASPFWGEEGATFLFSGPPEGVVYEEDAVATILGANSQMPMTVALPGDGNGDGFADLLIGANGPAAYYFLGPKAGTVSMDEADTVIDFSDPWGHSGSVSAAGDADANGSADLLVDAENGVFLIHTPISGTVTASSVATAALIPEGWHDDPCEHPGYHWYRRGEALGPGDLDGDGVVDFLVSTENFNRNWPEEECFRDRGIVYVQYGPVTGSVDLATADAHIDGDLDTTFARDVQPAGDVNGDGLADFLVTYPGYLVLGPASLSGFVSRLPDVVRFEGTNYMSGAGDVDGDGFDDVIAETDAFSVFLGPLTGTVTIEDAAWTFLPGDQLSAADLFLGAGDLDADGFDDFLIGSNDNIIAVFYGADF